MHFNSRKSFKILDKQWNNGNIFESRRVQNDILNSIKRISEAF